MADIKYLIVDAQWLLTRNFKQKCNYAKEGDIYMVDGKPVGDENNKPIFTLVPGFTASDLMTTFFQSVVKFTNDFYKAEKIILLWDKYPYHKFKFKENYKASRHYASTEDLEGLDPIKDAKEIIATKLEIDHLKIKQQAKSRIIEHFGTLGMPSLVLPGYEADDLAGEVAKYLSAKSNGTSLLWSVDSDWNYLTQPHVNHITPKGQIITYEEMMKEVGDLDMSLYEYKSWIDSLAGSHNDLERTISSEYKVTDWNECIKIIKGGDESILGDAKMFHDQLKSFSVVDYPEYDVVKDMISRIDSMGSIADPVSFSIFTSEQGLNVSNNYYLNYIQQLNQNLYKDEAISIL